MSELVLDSSAVLAFIQKEPGHETFSRAVGQSDAAWISAVILAEVLSKLMDNGATLQLAQEGFRLSSVSVLDFDAHLATEAAVLRGRTRALGLSFGDRACLALAMRLSTGVLTTDRALAVADVGLEIELMRE